MIKAIFTALICFAVISAASEHFDVIIIGSGSSAIGAAHQFTERNKKVLVLEKDRNAGGCAHEFAFNGAMFQTGFDVSTTAPNAWALEELYGDKPLLSWPAGYPRMRHIVGDRVYDVPNDKCEYYEWLYDNLGSANADTLIRQMRGMIHNHIPTFGLPGWDFVQRSTQSVINAEQAIVGRAVAEIGSQTMLMPYLYSMTANTDLHAAMVGAVVFFTAIPPQLFPAVPVVGGMAQQATGFSFPLAGSLQSSNVMVQDIEANGGQVVTRATVAQVIIDRNAATGVQLVNGTVFAAKKVLSTIGLDALLPMLGGRAIAGGWTSSAPPGPRFQSGSALITFLTFDDTARKLGMFPLQFIWPNDGMDGMQYIFAGVTGLEIGELPLLVIETTLKTSAFYPDVNPQPLAAMEIATPLYVYPFMQWQNSTTHHRPADYYAFKQYLQDIQMEQFYAAFPNLLGHVTGAESATPLTIRDFVAKPNGAFENNVGLSQEQRPNYYTGISNLYFTGADIACGADMAPMTGALAALEILNDKHAFAEYLENIK